MPRQEREVQRLIERPDQEAVRAAGGFGEAVLPHELMRLVERALAEANRADDSRS